MTGAATSSPLALECTGLTVAYESRPVLRALDLVVGHNEAVAVLGPSGCGKTTLLSTVAGFVAPRAGEIRIDGELVATGRHGRPPEDRRVGVVFQNYALWPHLDALDIVAYPLRRDGLGKSQARRQAMVLLDRMGIAGLARRRPAELSGGEQQRVGVARALARRAALYLFDEPTAHLDTALRGVLQAELADQRSSLGAAVLYATHDVAEALAVADRVALQRDGSIVQVAAPSVVYEQPHDLWAARLTGPAAVLDVSVVRSDGRTAELNVAGLPVQVHANARAPLPPGPASALIRPEWAGLGGMQPGRVTGVRYRGPDTDYRLDTPGGAVEVREPGPPRARVGEAPGWTLRRVWLLAPQPPTQRAASAPESGPGSRRRAAGRW